MTSPRDFEHLLVSVFATSSEGVLGWEKRENIGRLSSLSQRRPRKSRTRKETPQDVGIIHIIGRPLLRRSALCLFPQRRAGRPTPACLLFLHE